MKTARPETEVSEVSEAVVERATRWAAGLETRSEAAAAARTWVHYRP